MRLHDPIAAVIEIGMLLLPYSPRPLSDDVLYVSQSMILHV